MLNDFAKDVSDLTNGEVEFEILPAGAVVGVQETLEAVDKGLTEGGFAWTHRRAPLRRPWPVAR